jgi:hypothetical protein
VIPILVSSTNTGNMKWTGPGETGGVQYIIAGEAKTPAAHFLHCGMLFDANTVNTRGITNARSYKYE